MTDTPVISESKDPDVIRTGPGWKQVTPLRGQRYYVDLAGDPSRRHTSISSLPWPDDWSGAARWMTASWVSENHDKIPQILRDAWAEAEGTEEEKIQKALRVLTGAVSDGGESKLDDAADRGTALHHYLEHMVTGEAIDWQYIRDAKASEWLQAADNYLREREECERLSEVVVFASRTENIDGQPFEINTAGTVDEVDLNCDRIIVRDFKSRTSKHDRRQKEAAQLGGYADALLNGCYKDEYGASLQLGHIDAVEVVTFMPDGTFAIHRSSVEVALRAHRVRLPLLWYTVPNLFGKAEYGGADRISDALQERLEALDPAAAEQLAGLWREHKMPRFSEMTADRYVDAAELFEAVEPFRTPQRPVEPLATTAESQDLMDRLAALPSDISAHVATLMSGHRHYSSVVFNRGDWAMWDETLQRGEAAYKARLEELGDVLDLGANPDLVHFMPSADARQWTNLELELAYAVRDALEGGWIVRDGDSTATTPAGEAELERVAGGKRSATSAAKAECERRPRAFERPSKYGEVVAQPALVAVTIETLRTEP